MSWSIIIMYNFMLIKGNRKRTTTLCLFSSYFKEQWRKISKMIWKIGILTNLTKYITEIISKSSKLTANQNLKNKNLFGMYQTCQRGQYCLLIKHMTKRLVIIKFALIFLVLSKTMSCFVSTEYLTLWFTSAF